MASRNKTFINSAFAVFVLFALIGCAMPQWRVFQKKIDAKQAETPKAQAEGQKRAAAWIRHKSKPPVANPAQAVAEIHEVATGLSASLGEPEKPITDADKDAIIADLQNGLRAKEAQLDAWKKFARTYAGKPIEDTGVNLAGPAGLLGLAAVVALCVAFPAFGYVLLRVVPLLWGFFRRTTEAVGEFTKSNPDAGKKLGRFLGDKMDSAHKRLVRVRAKASKIKTLVPSPT